MLCVASRTAAQHAPPATTSEGKDHAPRAPSIVSCGRFVDQRTGGRHGTRAAHRHRRGGADREESRELHPAQCAGAGLSKASGQTVTVTTTEDLADAMRATRSGGYDIFIGPPQVAASALQRGYELVGCSQKSDHYVLVGLPQIDRWAPSRASACTCRSRTRSTATWGAAC